MSLNELAILRGGILSTGVFPDFKSQAPPLFVSAQNYLFSKHRIQTFLGTQDLFSTGITEAILGVEAVLVDGAKHIVFGTSEDILLWDGSAVSNEGTGYTAQEDETASTLADIWDFMSWGNNWIIANNGRDSLQIWKGAGFSAISDFESLYSSAYVLGKWGQFALAFALEGDDDRVAWSANNDPEVWTPTATNLAGSIFFRDLESRIYCALPFGNVNAVLGADTLHALFFNQTSLVFSQRRMLKGIGAFGKRSVCNAEGILYGAGQRGIWRSDGTSSEYIHDPAVKKEIYNNINLEQTSKITAFYDNQIQAVCFLTPVGEQNFLSEGWAFSIQDNSWSPFELAATAVTTSGVYPFPIISNKVGAILGQSIYDQGLNQGSVGGVWQLNTPEVLVYAPYGSAGYGDGQYGGVLYDGDG